MKFGDYVKIENGLVETYDDPDILWHPMRRQYIGGLVNEIFDKKVQCDIKGNTSDFFRATFLFDEYTFDAILLKTETWGLSFYRTEDKHNPDTIFLSKKNKKHTSVVFAGVFNCMDLLIKKKTVNSFYFETGDDDLKDFYVKLVPYIEREFPDFKLTSTFMRNNRKSFVFERNKP